jgi:hypothetical protein
VRSLPATRQGEQEHERPDVAGLRRVHKIGIGDAVRIVRHFRNLPEAHPLGGMRPGTAATVRRRRSRS